ncbi:conserved hypothetical protein [Klebsiella quasipneumoniae subsp. similipneumoniae]|nr:conserved hypothetical protein [Klebsiella quasipneumoniae subsp. similipneumoniae]
MVFRNAFFAHKLNSYKNLDHMFAIARPESVSRLAKRIFHLWPLFSGRSKAPNCDLRTVVNIVHRLRF